MENLGDRILFLSQGGLVSICASEMGGRRIAYTTFLIRLRGVDVCTWI